MDNSLAELLERAESWSKDAQIELLRVAEEIAREQKSVYVLSDAERVAIETGLADVNDGRLAAPTAVENLFLKCRN
jgi:predicted transcriptional regulator